MVMSFNEGEHIKIDKQKAKLVNHIKNISIQLQTQVLNDEKIAGRSVTKPWLSKNQHITTYNVEVNIWKKEQALIKELLVCAKQFEVLHKKQLALLKKEK